MIEKFETLRLNSKIGSFTSGLSEILVLREVFGFGLLKCELEVGLFLFLSGHFSKKWAAEPQYKHGFSLLLRFLSSFDKGP